MSQDHYIDWRSSETHLFVNRKDPALTQLAVNFSSLPTLAGHIWLSSSGTTSAFSLYALSKSGFLVSAEAVNAFLKLSKKDIWLNVLPLHHVGGLSIFARAFCSQSKVFDRGQVQWSAKNFHEWAKESKATVTSLVPTQVFDLVKFNEKCPTHIRFIIVGGAALNEELYVQAVELGYKLLPSYGMTECCSQIGTASPFVKKDKKVFPDIVKLPHVEVSTFGDQRLMIRSKSLFSAHAYWNKERREWDSLKRVGQWYTTKDRVQIDKKNESLMVLKPLGRISEQIKISGEWVNLVALNNLFRDLVKAETNAHLDFHIFALKDLRRGEEIAICFLNSDFRRVEPLVHSFNSKIIPVAKIRAAYFTQNLPRTDLGKVKIIELKAILGI